MTYAIASSPVPVTTMPARADNVGGYNVRIDRLETAIPLEEEAPLSTNDLLSKGIAEAANQLRKSDPIAA